MRLLLPLACMATAAGAEGYLPPPDYFTGIYQRVGRSGGESPALIDDLVRLIPAPGGEGLILRPCTAGGKEIALRPDRFGDVSNLLSTPAGQDWLGCQYFNDIDNYPILNCHDGEGGLITLWPANDRATEACATAP